MRLSIFIILTESSFHKNVELHDSMYQNFVRVRLGETTSMHVLIIEVRERSRVLCSYAARCTYIIVWGPQCISTIILTALSFHEYSLLHHSVIY